MDKSSFGGDALLSLLSVSAQPFPASHVGENDMPNFRLLTLAAPALLLCTSLGAAQYDRNDHQNFNRGLNQGGHGGYYHHQDDNRYGNGGYYGQGGNGYNGYRDDHRGGIGPGKGALIGGASGAVLGAVFGGGLKGSLIGGAAGAGIGAIAGQVHQNHRDDRYYGR